MVSLPSPRYILIHAHKAVLDANDLDPRGHAFGPFDSYADAVEFDKQTPEDSCYRFAVPLIGPESSDMALTQLGLSLGVRPGTLPLPPREPNANDELRRRLLKVIKKAKKEAKRQAKAAAEHKNDETPSE